MSLNVELRLSKADFATNAESARLDVSRLSATVNQLAASLLAMQQAAKAAGSTVASSLSAQIKDTQGRLNQAKQDLRSAQTAQATYAAASGQNDPNAPRESFRGNRAATSTVRTLLNSLQTGANPIDQLQSELPHLMQAAGASLTAQISTQLAVGMAVAIAKAINDTAMERQKFAQELAGTGVGTGSGSTGALTTQIGELKKASDELYDPNALFGRNSLFGAGWNKVKNAYRSITGDSRGSVEEETGNKIEALENRRILLSDELAKRKAAEADLEKRAAEHGADSVAIDKERLALRERIQAIQDNTSIDASAQAKMVDALKAESAEREKIIQAQIQQRKIAREEDRDAVLRRHPGIASADGNPDNDNFLHPSRSQVGSSRAIQDALAKRDAARREEQALRQRSLDTTEAHAASVRAEGELRDRLVDRELQTPEERRRADNEQAEHDRAEQRIEGRRRTDDERAAANASMDPIGAAPTIPDNTPIGTPNGPVLRQVDLVPPGSQGSRMVDPPGGPKTAAGKDFKGALSKTEGLLEDIKKNVTFKVKGGSK